MHISATSCPTVSLMPIPICLFLFIMYFVHDTILDIGIGKNEENETGNEEGQTSGGKSTKVPVA